RYLWEAGLDFDHGTGHGVGSYLSVHEGPQRISKLGTTPLAPGMILSNEPGYYRAGEYGIRLENLVIVEKREIKGAERETYGFETITMAPFDLNCIEPKLMGEDEIAWLNAYHAKVRKTLSPLVDAKTRKWLREATRAI
ncbi:MAG: M24 family metallopeptidase C-terminal domain-containing protein, partial [Methylocystis sp.]|nr:M24 family metallopeptidase C-terminal domain-containing protein [Methylocystis sp.]